MEGGVGNVSNFVVVFIEAFLCTLSFSSILDNENVLSKTSNAPETSLQIYNKNYDNQ